MRKRRASSAPTGLTFQEGRELVIRIKTLEGKAQLTIESYHKLFNDFEWCSEAHD